MKLKDILGANAYQIYIQQRARYIGAGLNRRDSDAYGMPEPDVVFETTPVETTFTESEVDYNFLEKSFYQKIFDPTENTKIETVKYLCWRYGVGGTSDFIWRICRIKKTTFVNNMGFPDEAGHYLSAITEIAYPFGRDGYNFSINVPSAKYAHDNPDVLPSLKYDEWPYYQLGQD